MNEYKKLNFGGIEIETLDIKTYLQFSTPKKILRIVIWSVLILVIFALLATQITNYYITIAMTSPIQWVN